MPWAPPCVNWADPSLTTSKKSFKIALDRGLDQPFVATRTCWAVRRSIPFRTSRSRSFCADFLHTPSGLNQGQNINGYWMEQSRGQIGAGKIDAVPHAQASVEEYRRGRAGGCRGSSQKTRRRFSA
jgi:hypothetical protein